MLRYLLEAWDQQPKKKEGLGIIIPIVVYHGKEKWEKRTFTTIADVLQLSADALLSDQQVDIKDMELLTKFEVIQQMEGKSKEMVLSFLDMVVRDFKAKQAYSH